MNARRAFTRAYAARPDGLRRRWVSGFTLIEVMIGACLTSVLLVAALSGVVALQKSYSATESYGTGLADQIRLLDYLALDLRRAVASSATVEPWSLDGDGNGIKITVPDYFRFNSNDPQHLFPVANDAILDPSTGVAYYSSAVSSGTTAATVPPTIPYQTIAYRYNPTLGVITRSDPWQPLVPDGTGKYKSNGPIVVATSMDAFPAITKDTDVDATGGSVVRYNITFYSTFQPLAVRGSNNTSSITLHNKTFIRSKNLAQ